MKRYNTQNTNGILLIQKTIVTTRESFSEYPLNQIRTLPPSTISRQLLNVLM